MNTVIIAGLIVIAYTGMGAWLAWRLRAIEWAIDKQIDDRVNEAKTSAFARGYSWGRADALEAVESPEAGGGE